MASQRSVSILALVASLGMAGPAAAQSFDFTRDFPAGAVTTLDVRTTRGKIAVTGDATGGVTVNGSATVRVGWNVPADAEQMARDVAAHPPIRQDGATLRLEPPPSNVDRGVTVAYDVHVPAATVVVTRSASGETKIERVDGTVTATTQSSTILLLSLGGQATVKSGSGDVTVVGITGDVSVSTSSSGIMASDLGGAFKATTSSGRVEASFSGSGDADVQTSSSAVRLSRLAGGVTVTTNSGEVRLDGRPTRAWKVTTHSSAIGARLPADAAVTLDLSSRSSDVKVEGADVSGATAKGRASGQVHGGGPALTFSTRSGAIQVTFGASR